MSAAADAEAIAAAALQSPMVASLSGGIETYLPGRRPVAGGSGPSCRPPAATRS